MELDTLSQVLQTLVDKTNDHFSFGVKSCWLVLPMLQSIYVYSAPHRHEVFAQNDGLHDPNLDIRIPHVGDFLYDNAFPDLTFI